MTYATVAQYAGEIAGTAAGESWPKRFLSCHHDLKVKMTVRLEKACAKALNRSAVGEFYGILEEIVKGYNILPGNTYNMDEKGIQLGIGARTAAFVDYEQKLVYSIEDGNRELVTVIEAVCADGSVLHPSVIFQGIRRNLEWGRINPCNARCVLTFCNFPHVFEFVLCSISVSPNGWTDQELGSAWLEQDFDPATRDKAGDGYRLLILDGHNSHCTYRFCNYAIKHNILILCLPSHTTHALQPCDVGVFGPLAQAWKRNITVASQNLTAITKENLLTFYDEARKVAFKATTIISSFRKTGIWPLDRDVIPSGAFEPAKNTTTLAAQPLPAHLPTILTPTPDPTPTTSFTTATTLDSTTTGPQEPSGGTPIDDPVQRYHIEVPTPLHHTASRHDVRNENHMLREIIAKAAIALEQDYAQMKLMDLENEKLRKRAFAREEQKSKKKLVAGRARHMTTEDNLDVLAREDWEKLMKEVFKELAPRLKVQKKTITLFYQNLEKERKAAERAQKAEERKTKKASADAKKAAKRGHGHG